MKNTKLLNDSKKGFSLIECLISLSLFLIIVLACLEFFGKTRNIFFKLKENKEAREGVLAALGKIRTDLNQGGAGLIDPAQSVFLKGYRKITASSSSSAAKRNCLFAAISPKGRRESSSRAHLNSKKEETSASLTL